MTPTTERRQIPWCPVCVFYIAAENDKERCPRCDGELEHIGYIPEYMVSSLV